MPKQETLDSGDVKTLTGEQVMSSGEDTGEDNSSSAASNTSEKPLVISDDSAKLFESLSSIKMDNKPAEKEEPKVEAKTEDLEEKTEDKAEEEEKPEETKEEIEEKPAEEKVETAPVKKGRDLNGLDEEEIEATKGMSFKAFKVFQSRALESKRLKSELEEKKKQVESLQAGKELLPPSYYENPQSVIFSPEYRQAVKTSELSSYVINHWQRQLAKVKAGEKWQDLDNDPETGELVKSENLSEPTPEAEAEIIGHISGANARHIDYLSKVKAIVSGFQSQHNQLKSNIRQAEKEYFPVFEDEKNENAKSYLKQTSEEIKKLGINETNPLFSSFSKSTAMNLMFVGLVKSKDKEIADLKKQIETKKSVALDRKKAGPSSLDLGSSSSSTNGSKALPFSEISRLL